MEILGIIPARGGSKGIKEKNIRHLGGKPLITRSILEAKKSKKINRLIVSTDDPKIAKISKDVGAEIPFLRPKKISHDNSTVLELVKHAIKFLDEFENYKPDVICILQPTTPFRTFEMIDKSIKIIQRSNSTSVVSVSISKSHPDASFKIKNNYLKPLNIKFENHSLRQKRIPVYFPTGYIYTFRNDSLQKNNSIYGPRISPLFHDPKLPVIDIDDPFDFFIAEMFLKHWVNFKKKFK